MAIESSVISNGSKTLSPLQQEQYMFESSVISNGSKTDNRAATQDVSLRVV